MKYIKFNYQNKPFGDGLVPVNMTDGWHFIDYLSTYTSSESEGQVESWVNNENSHTLEIQTPGVKKENISIETKDNSLFLTYKDRNQDYSYSYSLPKGDIEKLTAKYEDGVLYLEIPKFEVSKPKKIIIS